MAQLCAIIFLLLIAYPSIVQASQSDQVQIQIQLDDLREQKKEIDGVISGLSGKPAQLQNFQRTLTDNYKYLARQKLRLEAIQLWNGFVGFVGVAFDCLQKINPGASTVVALATFVQDRATQTLSNANLKASINTLNNEIKGVDSSLRLLDRALKMTPAEVADQMVATGMVGDIESLSVRWEGTIRLTVSPEELAKSAAVVTGKNTLIQERIGPAMKSLYRAKMSAGKSIVEITQHLALAKRKSTELNVQITRLEVQIEYEKIKEDSYEPAMVNVHKESLAGDINPMSHSAAFADIKAAWLALRANAINGKTYLKIKSRKQAASLLYGQQQMEPFAKEYHRTRDYIRNELAAATRAISDRYVRIEFSKRKRAEAQTASDIFFREQEKDRKARDNDFFKPLKALHEEELSELQRLKEFKDRVKTLQQTQVSRTVLNIRDLKLETFTGPLRANISSRNLANIAWAGRDSDVALLKDSFKVEPELAPSLAKKAISKAEQLLSATTATSAQMQAIIDQAEALGSEMEANWELWNYIKIAPDLSGVISIPIEFYPAINVSSQMFSLRVNILRIIAIAEFEALKEEANQVIKASTATTERTRQVERAKAVVANWTQAKNISGDHGSISLATATQDLFQENNINQERINTIRQNISQLEKGPKEIEKHVLKALSGKKGQDSLVPDNEQLSILQGKYTDLKNALVSKRIAYPDQYTKYQESYIDLEEDLFAAQSRFTAAAPSIAVTFSIEMIMAEAGQPGSMSEWVLTDPADIPEPDPADDVLIQEFVTSVQRYNELTASYWDKGKKRYETARNTMNILSRKPMTTAILQADISPETFAKRIADLKAEALGIYEPLAFLDTEQVKTELGLGYQNLLANIEQAKQHYIMIWYQQTYQKLEIIDAKIQKDQPLSQDQIDTYHQELTALIAPGSFADQMREDRQVDNLVIMIEELLAQLKQGHDPLAQITLFYETFKQAYEAKNETLVLSFIADDWTTPGGVSLYDLEDNLRNMYTVFDDIQYSISGLQITTSVANIYTVSYSVTILGMIYDNDLSHEEVSNVVEQLKMDDSGQFKINRTLGGNYWSIK